MGGIPNRLRNSSQFGGYFGTVRRILEGVPGEAVADEANEGCDEHGEASGEQVAEKEEEAAHQLDAP
jgi:hypothetical protein